MHIHQNPRIFSILKQICTQVLKHWEWYTGNENMLWSLLESLRRWCLSQNSHERLELITEHPSQFPWTLKEVWVLQKDCGFPIDRHLSLKRRERTLRKRSPLGTNQAEGISYLAFSTNTQRMFFHVLSSLCRFLWRNVFSSVGDIDVHSYKWKALSGLCWAWLFSYIRRKVAPKILS